MPSFQKCFKLGTPYIRNILILKVYPFSVFELEYFKSHIVVRIVFIQLFQVLWTSYFLQLSIMIQFMLPLLNILATNTFDFLLKLPPHFNSLHTPHNRIQMNAFVFRLNDFTQVIEKLTFVDFVRATWNEGYEGTKLT